MKKNLSNNHEAFTFEMNNKGQLKREFPPGHGRKEEPTERARELLLLARKL